MFSKKGNTNLTDQTLYVTKRVFILIITHCSHWTVLHIMTSSNGNFFPRYWPFVRGIHRWQVDSPHKKPVTRSLDIFFDLRLNKWLNKQRGRRWFERVSHSLWRHCDDFVSRDRFLHGFRPGLAECTRHHDRPRPWKAQTCGGRSKVENWKLWGPG